MSALGRKAAIERAQDELEGIEEATREIMDSLSELMEQGEWHLREEAHWELDNYADRGDHGTSRQTLGNSELRTAARPFLGDNRSSRDVLCPGATSNPTVAGSKILQWSGH